MEYVPAGGSSMKELESIPLEPDAVNTAVGKAGFTA